MISSRSIYLFADIKSSAKYFTEAGTRGVHIADEKKPVCRYGQILYLSNSFFGQSLWKTFFIQWLIFILFGASFPTSVTKLYPKRNRGESRSTAKSKMELFVKKINGFQFPAGSSRPASTLILIFSNINIF